MGNLTYFLGINQAVWIPYLVGIAVYGYVFLISGSGKYKLKINSVNFFLNLFLIAILFCWIINLSPIMQVVVGGKNLVGLWSVYLLISTGIVAINKMERIILFILPFTLIQVPFVLYQHFFIASTRSIAGGEAGVAWDAVVGTFGGDPLGGGASGALAFLIAISIVLSITLWKRKIITATYFASLLAASAICLSVAEVKVVVVLIPLGLAIVGASMVRESPIFVIASVILSLIAVVALLNFYTDIHEGGIQVGDGSITDLLDGAFWYSLDGGFINLRTGEMGRMAALNVWWEDGFQFDLLRGLFGYGPGASRSGSAFAVGEAARGYVFNIDRSSAAQILWECGLVGFILLCGILVSGCITAFRISKKCEDNPQRRAILETCSAMFLMVLVMLPYSRDFLEVPGMGVIVMICLGFVVQVSQQNKLREY